MYTWSVHPYISPKGVALVAMLVLALMGSVSWGDFGLALLFAATVKLTLTDGSRRTVW